MHRRIMVEQLYDSYLNSKFWNESRQSVKILKMTNHRLLFWQKIWFFRVVVLSFSLQIKPPLLGSKSSSKLVWTAPHRAQQFFQMLEKVSEKWAEMPSFLMHSSWPAGTWSCSPTPSSCWARWTWSMLGQSCCEYISNNPNVMLVYIVS